MQKTLSLVAVFAILAWTVSLNMARAECQMPLNPDENSYTWYYNCTRDEAVREQYAIQQQAARLRALEQERGVLPGFNR